MSTEVSGVEMMYAVYQITFLPLMEITHIATVSLSLSEFKNLMINRATGRLNDLHCLGN
jgi:hypothetical protein